MLKLLLATILTAGACHGAGTLIDVSFPGGTGTNPTFLVIDNAVGANSWTQSTGVLSTSTANNSAVGAASDTTIDFGTLGSDSLVLTVDVSSVTGSGIANGIFVGFQQRNMGGAGTDLWNNNPPAFGLVMPGSPTIGLGVRAVAVGGSDPSNPGRYQFSPGYGVATLASIQDGFTMTLTLDSSGWDLALTGLQDAGANPITGGSGAWGAGGINDWAEFNNEMRVGASYQTNAGAGDFNIASITLTQVPEPSALAFLGIAAFGMLRRRR